MQHVLGANKKRLVQGCKNAVAHSRHATKTWSARTFFNFYISCIWMLYGKAYMCALLKIAALYKHSQKILHPWSSYKILINALFVIHSFDDLLLWMSGFVASFVPLLQSLVTTLCKFYRCSIRMLNIALCIHFERWIPVPLWRNYKIIRKSKSLQPWLSESVVTKW